LRLSMLSRASRLSMLSRAVRNWHAQPPVYRQVTSSSQFSCACVPTIHEPFAPVWHQPRQHNLVTPHLTLYAPQQIAPQPPKPEVAIYPSKRLDETGPIVCSNRPETNRSGLNTPKHEIWFLEAVTTYKTHDSAPRPFLVSKLRMRLASTST
jgi:hypothetical protein